MHEFSIAQNIIEIVEEAVKLEKKSRVSHVELDIGSFSGIEIVALETALECLTPESMLKNAQIQMNSIKGIAKCRKCAHQYTPEDIFTPCPECNNFGPEIISGKEMIVKSITIE